MTWNEKRIVTVLSTVLVVLMAAVLVALSIRYRQGQAQQAEGGYVDAQGQAVADDEYVSVQLDNGSFAPTFALGAAGEWIWADQQDFPLNDETVQAVLAILDDPKPQQTLPMEGGPGEYALENPRATVTATRGDGSTRVIQLGKATTDGQSYYAMLDGDETTVYILSGQLHELLQTPVYAMMELPELPDLSGENLLSVSILGHLGDNASAPMLTLEAKQEEGQKPRTRWFAGEEEVTDNALVQGLMADLAALTLGRCVDYNPSEDALEICGLTDPAAVLTIRYLNSNGGEQELQLSIGTRVTDGSGRYMQMNGDSTIYFLPTDLLDPLMHMAAQGLAA